MKNNHKYLEKYQPDIANLYKYFGVSKLYAFGSVLTDKFSEQSNGHYPSKRWKRASWFFFGRLINKTKKWLILHQL